MSEVKPGLEGVVAGETAICSVRPEGSWSTAATTCTTWPSRRASRKWRTWCYWAGSPPGPSSTHSTRSCAPAGAAAGSGGEPGAAPFGRGSDGRVAHRGIRPGALRPGRRRRLARRQPEEGHAAAGASGHGGGGAAPALPGAGAGGAGSRAEPRRQLPPHAARGAARRVRGPGAGGDADPVHGARVQCLHVHRPGDRLHAGGPVRRGGGCHRRAQGAASRRRQREGDGRDPGDRGAGACGGVGGGEPAGEEAGDGVRAPHLQDRGLAGGGGEEVGGAFGQATGRHAVERASA